MEFYQKIVTGFALVVFSGLIALNSATRLDVGNANYILDYELKDNSTAIEFNITAKNVKGWVGIGINTQPSMNGSDLFIGGFNTSVNPNVQYGEDYHVPPEDGNTLPKKDPAQNWNLVSATENDTATYIRVNRLLNTMDTKHDLVIEDKEMYVIWVYHKTSDNVAENHTDMGSKVVNLLSSGSIGKVGFNTLLIGLVAAFLKQ